MITTMNGFLLDENSGEFVAEDGRKVSFHNARFYDTDDNKVIKVAIPESHNGLPEPQVNCLVSLRVHAGEKFCKLVFDSYEL